MNKSILTKCNFCYSDFYIRKFKTRKLRDEIERTYFDCPHCGREYTAYYTNESIRTKQRRMRDMRDELSKTTDDKRKVKLVKKMNQMIETIGNEMRKIKNQQEGKRVGG